MADIKAKKVIFKNRDGEHLIPYVGDSVIDHRITNCLLEIPQRIKLELNNGVLTLKAGSTVIVPNGFESDGTTYKFDYVTINEDKTYTITANGTYPILINTTSKTMMYSVMSKIISGATDSLATTTYRTWYDTTNNLVKRYNADVSTVAFYCSLPIAMVTVTNGAISSIDQVFNGFGYIGSTIWVDKGVKVLISNGKNADGTLKNTECVTSKIKLATRDIPIIGTLNLALNEDGALYDWDYYKVVKTYNDVTTNKGLHHVIDDNKMYYRSSKGVISVRYDCYVGTFYNSEANKDGKVTALDIKQPFRAVDYSDKAEISSWSMPSSKYIDLTLGASGSRYTAPANGWLFLQMAYQEDKYIDLFNSTSQTGSVMTSASANSALRTMIPCRKGDDIAIRYTATTVQTFRFIYTEGEV